VTATGAVTPVTGTGAVTPVTGAVTGATVVVTGATAPPTAPTAPPTAPPWDDTHPWGDLRRYKSTASRGYLPDERLHTRPRGDLLGAGWQQLGPPDDWLRDHVGPSRSAR
jgi:hypothetical protein